LLFFCFLYFCFLFFALLLFSFVFFTFVFFSFLYLSLANVEQLVERGCTAAGKWQRGSWAEFVPTWFWMPRVFPPAELSFVSFSLLFAPRFLCTLLLLATEMTVHCAYGRESSFPKAVIITISFYIMSLIEYTP